MERPRGFETRGRFLYKKRPAEDDLWRAVWVFSFSVLRGFGAGAYVVDLDIELRIGDEEHIGGVVAADGIERIVALRTSPFASCCAPRR